MENDFDTLSKQMKLEQAIDIIYNSVGTYGSDAGEILNKAIGLIRQAQRNPNLKHCHPYKEST